MQATEKPAMDHCHARECCSSMTIKVLTMNHGNLARNPKLDGRELKQMPMRDRPITRMLLRNSARIICLNEADAFLDPEDEKCKELIRLFIHSGYKGIVIKSWTARPIACFVRGNERTRPSYLLARYISTRSPNWGTTFGMFRCLFGTETDSADPEYDTPTIDCLATTGPHMSKENFKQYVGQRLPPQTAIQTYGHNKEIVVIYDRPEQ